MYSMKWFKRSLEKFIEAVLFMSSTVTTITVLFIIYFLFSEGLGIFNSSPAEHNYIMAVNPSNPVKELTSRQFKDIFNGDITTGIKWEAITTVLFFSL